MEDDQGRSAKSGHGFRLAQVGEREYNTLYLEAAQGVGWFVLPHAERGARMPSPASGCIARPHGVRQICS